MGTVPDDPIFHPHKALSGHVRRDYRFTTLSD